jgi:uncharacterized repeat protein (TIGR01451 family)
MRGSRRFAGFILTSALALTGTGAGAAALGVVKTSAVVSDPLNDVLPLRVPGAVLDYTVTVTNPLANGTTTVSNVIYSDPIPDKTALYVLDLAGVGKGPVVFSNGLPASNLTYTYTTISDTGDALDFSNDGGLHWTYVPMPDSGGFDAGVTNIRVRLTGNQTTGGSFALRFRVRVN